MLTNDLKNILHLHPVRINYSLAKHQRDMKSMSVTVNGGDTTAIGILNPQDAMSGGMSWPRGREEDIVRDADVWDGVPIQVHRIFNSPLRRAIAELYIRFRLLFRRPSKDPIEIFDEVKENFQELKGQNVDAEEMKILLRKLENAKQRSVIDQIKSTQKLSDLESILAKAGFTQYQPESAMVTFIRSVKKGLCLHEIEEFDRVIPDQVMDKFNEAEKLKVFDNYLILHYDPKKADNPYYTKEKAPKPRDPIMFGVIRNSDKMYFVADWIDEYCGLTYKEILSAGKDFKLKL